MLKEVMLSMVYNVNIYSYFKSELYDRGINYTSNLCMMILCNFFITDFVLFGPTCLCCFLTILLQSIFQAPISATSLNINSPCSYFYVTEWP